jgi:hypothetical protein
MSPVLAKKNGDGNRCTNTTHAQVPDNLFLRKITFISSRPVYGRLSTYLELLFEMFQYIFLCLIIYRQEVIYALILIFKDEFIHVIRKRN